MVHKLRPALVALLILVATIVLSTTPILLAAVAGALILWRRPANATGWVFSLAMLAFAVKLARRPEEIGDEDLDALRRAGFDDSDIWDIGSITAFFALSNRIAHLADLQPNPEFFALGR